MLRVERWISDHATLDRDVAPGGGSAMLRYGVSKLLHGFNDVKSLTTGAKSGLPAPTW